MKSLWLLLLMGIALSLQAQVPPAAFHYSAVARDANGEPLVEKAISLQVLLRTGSVMGPVVFEETHSITTDLYGLFTLIIGTGSLITGDISVINWAQDQYFLQVGLDPDGNMSYTLSEATQLLSVPYALHSGTSGKVLNPEYQSLSISNDTLFLTNGGFVKLPPANQTPSPYIQPEINFISHGMIGSNTATFQFYLDKIQDYEVSSVSILFSKNVDIFTQEQRFTNTSKLAGAYVMSNLIKYFQLSELFETSTTYYYRIRATTIQGISYFSPMDSLTSLAVGQQGPAGGLVFFDKGFVSDGWRYMEVLAGLPDPTMAFGCHGFSVTGMPDELGAGPANTDSILNYCAESNIAARYCADLNYGGYDDWFLPSASELYFAYYNLFQKGLGNFTNGAGYYTSNGGHFATVLWFVEDWYGTDTVNKTDLYYVRPVRRF